jgi:hypothetical protein
MSTLVSIGKTLTPRNVLVAVITHNMIARPAITLTNKNLPEDTRRYTASREFCTELFGLMNTLTFTTLIEWLGPRLANRNATSKMINHVKSTDWNKLAKKEQHLKAVILMSSLIGSAFSCGILTPLLNNFVLNQMLEKIIGNKQHPQGKPMPSVPMQNRSNPMTNTTTVQTLPAFNRIG